MVAFDAVITNAHAIPFFLSPTISRSFVASGPSPSPPSLQPSEGWLFLSATEVLRVSWLSLSFPILIRSLLPIACIRVIPHPLLSVLPRTSSLDEIGLILQMAPAPAASSDNNPLSRHNSWTSVANRGECPSLGCMVCRCRGCSDLIRVERGNVRPQRSRCKVGACLAMNGIPSSSQSGARV
ncbi:hypothetical protein DFH06DRAFT_1467348 [Mycena polygramma]|nr:hypothetical protein DFH06DRAFT_1467348 [Mycena polygramma]